MNVAMLGENPNSIDHDNKGHLKINKKYKMRWDLIVLIGGSTIILLWGAWMNHRRQRVSGWFEESDYDHHIEDFSWLSKNKI